MVCGGGRRRDRLVVSGNLDRQRAGRCHEYGAAEQACCWGFGPVLAIGGIGGFLYLRSQSDREPERADPSAADTDRQEPDEDAAADADYVIVGGVRRKRSDLAADEDTQTAKSVAATESAEGNYGQTPAIDPDANPEVASVVAALREKKHPERLSPMNSLPAFDAKAYQADPQAYLNTVEPGRAFQSAQPGPDVKVLQRTSLRLVKADAGRVGNTRSQGGAGCAGHLHARQLGQFENQLTSITKQANETGVARAEFSATPGTIDHVYFLAASPVTTGQARFLVDVAVPSGPAPAADAGP